MFDHFLNPCVAVNHSAGTVFGLLHNLRVVGPVELGDGDERGPVRVRRVVFAQILFRDAGHLLIRKSFICNLLALADANKQRTRSYDLVTTDNPARPVPGRSPGLG